MLFPFNSFPSRNSKVKIPKLSLVKISYLPFCFILSANVNDILVSGNKQFHLQNKKLKTAVAFIQFTADNEFECRMLCAHVVCVVCVMRNVSARNKCFFSSHFHNWCFVTIWVLSAHSNDEAKTVICIQTKLHEEP